MAILDKTIEKLKNKAEDAVSDYLVDKTVSTVSDFFKPKERKPIAVYDRNEEIKLNKMSYKERIEYEDNLSKQGIYYPVLSRGKNMSENRGRFLLYEPLGDWEWESFPESQWIDSPKTQKQTAKPRKISFKYDILASLYVIIIILSVPISLFFIGKFIYYTYFN